MYQNFPGYRKQRGLWEEHIRGKLFLARFSDRDFNSKNEKLATFSHLFISSFRLDRTEIFTSLSRLNNFIKLLFHSSFLGSF